MCGLIALVLLVAAVLVIKFLPWYASVGVFVAVGVALWLLRGRIALWICSAPFRMKGRVLKGAKATVHRLTRVPPPPQQPEFEDDEPDSPRDESPRDYYSLEVTISPASTDGPFHHWDADDLGLVASSTRVSLDTADDSCIVVENRIITPTIVESSQDEEDDSGSKVMGENRLTMLIGVKPGVRSLKFQYYMESFGSVTIPEG